MSVNSYLSRLDRNTAIDAAAAVAARAMATPATAERVKMCAGLTPAAADLAVLSGHHPDMAEVVQAIDPSGASPWYARAAFHDIGTQAVQTIARAVPPPRHRAFMALLQAADFKTHTAKFGFYGASLQEVGELGEYPVYSPDAGQTDTAAGSVVNYGASVAVYRQSLINDRRLGFLGRLSEALTGSAYRKEAALAYAAIEGNLNLGDGAAWFDATNSTTAPSVLQALVNGFELFHKQALPNGELLNAAPGVLVVPPTWSIQAGEVITDILLSLNNLVVIKSGAVSSGYLFANPGEFPALALLHLQTDGLPEVRVQRRPRAGFITDMELLTTASHPVAILPLSRLGVVKMSVES